MADLAVLRANFHAEIADQQLLINGVSYAPDDTPDDNISASVMFEGVFMRAFTAFENCMEQVFIHFAIGMRSLNGYSPLCRLANCSEAQAKAILVGSQRYLDWSSAQTVKERAEMIFQDGEPIASGIVPQSGVLSDIEKVRNMIAHNSAEASVGYLAVQRNNFRTERPFKMAPGQLLRARRRPAPSMHWCAHYMGSMGSVVDLITTKA